MRFHFVDQGGPSSGTRRAARSHVMKGKNAGRKLPSRGRRAPVEKLVNDEKKPQLEDTITALRSLVSSDLSPLAPTTWAELPPRTQLLLSQDMYVVGDAIYPPELCQPSEVLKTAWFELLLNDKAFFHVALSVTATCLDFYQRSEHDSPQAIAHANQAFTLINQRLSGNKRLSDSTIVLTCLLSIQESLRGDLKRYKIHLHGLYRMVEVRGGIKAFEDKAEVVKKIYRADIQYALHTNSRSLYYADEMPKGVVESLAKLQTHAPKLLSNMFENGPSSVQQLVREIEVIAFMFNSVEGKPTLSAHDFQSIVISTCYRLMGVRLTGFITAGNRGCIVGLLCFMTTLVLQFGRQRHLRYDMLSWQLKRSICELTVGLSLPAPIILWLLVVGGVSVFEQEDEAWLLPETSRWTQLLGLADWESVHQQLQEFPWIDVIHSAHGKALLMKSQRISSDRTKGQMRSN